MDGGAVSEFNASMITALLEQAVGLHQQGKLAPALELYQRVLDIDPHHFDALHLSGVIARQQGRIENAIELIGRALSINAKIGRAHV